MKRAPLFFVLILLALVVTACASPAVQGLDRLPDEGRLLIMTLVTSLFTWVLIKLSQLIGINLAGYAEPLAAVVAPIIITFIESYLQLIPPIFDELVITVIHIIVLLIGSVGTYIITRRVKSKETKSLLA